MDIRTFFGKTELKTPPKTKTETKTETKTPPKTLNWETIVGLLEAGGPQTSRQIAKALSVHKHDINKIIYAHTRMFERVNAVSVHVPVWGVKDNEEECPECGEVGDTVRDTEDGRMCCECAHGFKDRECGGCGFTFNPKEHDTFRLCGTCWDKENGREPSAW